MKRISRFFYYFGLIFWGIGFIYSFFNLIALNGLGNIFEVNEPEKTTIKMERDTVDVTINYKYYVGSKEYSSTYHLYAKSFDKYKLDTIVVKYNRTFPMISYIDGVPLKIRHQKTGIVISSFFILFIFLIWKLSNRKKWVKAYEEVGSRPWLYANDKTIKDRWKRLINKLFQKPGNSSC